MRTRGPRGMGPEPEPETATVPGESGTATPVSVTWHTGDGSRAARPDDNSKKRVGRERRGCLPGHR
jgi:hypothetical protein